jgi:hypothetical protein
MNAVVTTCNMAEALHLLRRRNRVVKVEMVCTMPYGMEECALVFEGEKVEADHLDYLKHGIDVNLSALPELFAAIAAVLPAKGGTV